MMSFDDENDRLMGQPRLVTHVFRFATRCCLRASVKNDPQSLDLTES